MDDTHVVQGDTFKHKDAIRAAGGKWDAADNVWTVPAGAKLPAGLSAKPRAETPFGVTDRLKAAVDMSGVIDPDQYGYSLVQAATLKPPPADERGAYMTAKQAIAHSMRAGLMPDVTANELVRAGHSRATVARVMQEHHDRLHLRSEYFTPERIARNKQAAADWLARNAG